jgi:hypothetical protein
MNRHDFLEILKNCEIERRDYDLVKILDEYDEDDKSGVIKLIDSIILSRITKNEYRQCTVLGLDLYAYSKFEFNKQTLIPFVFDLLYQETRINCVEYEGCFFEGYSFEDNFISIGDGCYQIFDNPIQAFIFNANFYITLHTYNVCRFYPELRIYTGDLFFRSCITSGKKFSYEKNHYGPAIITNARILSRDKLNRFLIDEKTYRWFLAKIDGIENIGEIPLEELLEILDIYPDWGRTAIFRTNETYKMDDHNKFGRKYGKIKSCHVQKIGNISAKEELFSVYNVEIQIYTYIFNPNDSVTGRGMVVSIGNSNNSGI